MNLKRVESGSFSGMKYRRTYKYTGSYIKTKYIWSLVRNGVV